ncbi:Hypothetical protein PHPALM_14903 [Phytophthora palmivora]|uniref:PiggyBac transposable element-derived protein domain-containing protein n=1 Tax=Phytophthora palmivora TaxID=4796 RepID=A0A2P4XTS4_9STRA|nr:Hypothetical protein PHPALM_14903 [Phytophthora palmivora]
MMKETKNHKKIQPEDVVHCIGLLIARMLNPHKKKIADHWSTYGVGAVPKVTFGVFVRKALFDRIVQNLHFTNNADARVETDRAWKVSFQPILTLGHLQCYATFSKFYPNRRLGFITQSSRTASIPCAVVATAQCLPSWNDPDKQEGFSSCADFEGSYASSRRSAWGRQRRCGEVLPAATSPAMVGPAPCVSAVNWTQHIHGVDYTFQGVAGSRFPAR